VSDANGSPPAGAHVSAQLVEDFASTIESKVGDIEDVVDDVMDKLEHANVATGALIALVRSMRQQVSKARAAEGK
jgi:hypothetical protein